MLSASLNWARRRRRRKEERTTTRLEEYYILGQEGREFGLKVSCHT